MAILCPPSWFRRLALGRKGSPTSTRLLFKMRLDRVWFEKSYTWVIWQVCSSPTLYIQQDVFEFGQVRVFVLQFTWYLPSTIRHYDNHPKNDGHHNHNQWKKYDSHHNHNQCQKYDCHHNHQSDWPIEMWLNQSQSSITLYSEKYISK